jgi:RHS repeat-associated protein
VADTADGACTNPASAIFFGWNHLTEVRTATSRTTFAEYDGLGRVLQSTQTTAVHAYPFTYHYKPAGPDSMTYPSGRTVSFGLSGAGRVASVGGYVSTVNYAAHGAVSSLSLSNGVTETTDYNARLQPYRITATRGSTLFQYSPLHCAVGTPGDNCATNNGNVVAASLAGPGLSATEYFQYDGLNRLTLAVEKPANASNLVCPDAGSEWCEKFGYDAWGNRTITARTNVGVSLWEAAGYYSTNRMSPDTDWHYDGAGNILKNAANQTFSYDAEGRMTAGGGMQYGYDADGQRVLKTASDGKRTVYVYDAMGQLAAEYSEAPGPAPLCSTCYLTADHLGSTRLVTDQLGAVVQRKDYLPFGDEVLAGTGSVRYGVDGYLRDSGVTQQFTGKERDTETGLDFFEARYYSGAQGRFTGADEPFMGQYPYDPQSWNLYAYGLNNPLRYSDPSGHEPCENGINPENGNICTVVTAPPPEPEKPEPVDPGQVIIGGASDVFNLLPMLANAIYWVTENTPGYNGPRVRMPYITPANQSQKRGAIISSAAMLFAGRLPVLKGQAGVLRAIGEVEAEGATVLGSEVWIATNAGRIRADFVATDAAGNLFIGEAKNGASAGFTVNQLANGYPTGGPVSGVIMSSNIPGLPAGTPIQDVAVRVFKY